MGKISAQLPVGSDQWHMARCDEPGSCNQDSTTNEAAKAACRRDDCAVGRANVLHIKLQGSLAQKAGPARRRPRL